MPRLSPRLAVLAAAAVLLAAAPAAPVLGAPAAPDAAARLSTATRTIQAHPDGTLTASVALVEKSGWGEVFSNHATRPFWDGDAETGASVGFCGWVGCTVKVARSYFVFDTAFLAGAQVISARFETVVIHSPTCQASAHQLYAATGFVGPGLNWKDQPGAALLGTQSAPVAYSGGCPGPKPVVFDVARGINPLGASAYSLRAVGEGDPERDVDGDRLAWRKYDPARTQLVVTFEPAG